ncbi:MAG TPA: hypothetical protein DHW82_10860 [Spirochaetia bacterium]|nr:hypothetical protein [Spirochaetia bacterium]
MPLNKFTLKKNETQTIYENIKLTFLSHSHKKTYQDGPPSPLILNISYETEGLIENKEYHLNTNYELIQQQKEGWEWKDFSFFLTDYKYNEFITFEVYKK